MGGCGTNQQDCEGCTPLELPAGQGNQAALTLLLIQDDFNSNKKYQHDETPLTSSVYEHEGVVRLLLTWDDADPNSLPNVMYHIPQLWGKKKNGKQRL